MVVAWIGVYWLFPLQLNSVFLERNRFVMRKFGSKMLPQFNLLTNFLGGMQALWPERCFRQSGIRQSQPWYRWHSSVIFYIPANAESCEKLSMVGIRMGRADSRGAGFFPAAVLPRKELKGWAKPDWSERKHEKE